MRWLTRLTFSACIGLVSETVQGNGDYLSQEQAVRVANQEVVGLGLDLKDFDVKADLGDKNYRQYIKQYKHGQAGEAAQREALQDEAAIEGKDFWDVTYTFKRQRGTERLGGVTVLVDALSGEVLLLRPPHSESIIRIRPQSNK